MLSELAPLHCGLDKEHVHVPGWGHGYNPSAFSTLFAPNKLRVGLNDRFAVGGARAMSVYHSIYTHLCHRELGGAMPASINFEQMYHWFLGVRRQPYSHLAGGFYFFRLRTGSAYPTEHPGHRPALTDDTQRRWDLWRAALEELWGCGDPDALGDGCWLRGARASYALGLGTTASWPKHGGVLDLAIKAACAVLQPGSPR